MTDWYIGQKINTYCFWCNERLTTFVKNVNGEPSRLLHIKCEKILRKNE